MTTSNPVSGEQSGHHAAEAPGQIDRRMFLTWGLRGALGLVVVGAWRHFVEDGARPTLTSDRLPVPTTAPVAAGAEINVEARVSSAEAVDSKTDQELESQGLLLFEGYEATATIARGFDYSEHEVLLERPIITDGYYVNRAIPTF